MYRPRRAAVGVDIDRGALDSGLAAGLRTRVPKMVRSMPVALTKIVSGGQTHERILAWTMNEGIDFHGHASEYLDVEA